MPNCLSSFSKPIIHSLYSLRLYITPSLPRLARKYSHSNHSCLKFVHQLPSIHPASDDVCSPSKVSWEPMHYSLNSCCLSGGQATAISQVGYCRRVQISLPALLCALPTYGISHREQSERNYWIRSWHSLDSVLASGSPELFEWKRNSIMAPFPPLQCPLVPPSPLPLGSSHTGILSAPPVPLFSATRPRGIAVLPAGQAFPCFPAELTMLSSERPSLTSATSLGF